MSSNSSYLLFHLIKDQFNFKDTNEKFLLDFRSEEELNLSLFASVSKTFQNKTGDCFLEV